MTNTNKPTKFGQHSHFVRGKLVFSSSKDKGSKQTVKEELEAQYKEMDDEVEEEEDVEEVGKGGLTEGKGQEDGKAQENKSWKKISI